MHKNNYFLTLTYDDEHIDRRCGVYDEEFSCICQWSLNKIDFPKFMKKLRKEYGNGIKFYQAGEYGGQTGRPHHHACIFNIDIKDLKLWKNAGGIRLYTSDSVQQIWGNGYVVIGDVSFESAAYISRYITKKITGDSAQMYYNGLQPEYATMSRRPGIGLKYFEKYKKEIIDNDGIIMRGGLKMRPPRYYDKKREEINAQEMEVTKKMRKSSVNIMNNTPKRLAVREQIKKATVKNWKREKSC